MGSVCELQLYSPVKDNARSLADKLIGEVQRLEDKYTRYKPASVTSRINAAAGKQHAIDIDDETARLLDYADVLHQQSDGLFDITSGVLRSAWDFRSNRLPARKTLDALLPLIGWQKVLRSAQTIRLPIDGMQIDFGGYVKEYAADVVETMCLDAGIQHGLVNLGGDVRVVGPHPDGSPWNVGIQHPRKKGKTIAVVKAAHGAVATSGDYERYMIVDGQRYCHLLNPLTGQSMRPKLTSATVIADSCLIAGSFSTLAMFKSVQEEAWLASTGLPHLLVDQSLNLTGTIR